MGLGCHYIFLISQGITRKQSVALTRHSAGRFNRRRKRPLNNWELLKNILLFCFKGQIPSEIISQS